MRCGLLVCRESVERGIVVLLQWLCGNGSIRCNGRGKQGKDALSVCPKFRTDAKPKSTHRHSPYEYSYNSSQPHINCKHQTWLINTLLVSQNVANRKHSWLPCQRELDCDKAISYYKLQHSAISSTLIFAQPYLSQD